MVRLVGVLGGTRVVLVSRAALRGVADVVFPPSCLACRKAVAARDALCASCWAAMRFIERPFCERLGTPFAADLETPGLLSPDAIAHPPVFSRARAVARFEDGPSRQLVHRLKYGDRLELAGDETVLDVGFSGYDNPDRKAALPDAIGIDIDYPGYDGLHLPFADESVDTVFSSHCLEHVAFEHAVIQDWYRVLKVGGFVVCIVPHQGLYEKRRHLHSRWNMDHKRMYTPASLAGTFEAALPMNGFRIRHLRDNDAGFDYSRGPQLHSDGAYEIEIVIEKICPPTWTLD